MFEHIEERCIFLRACKSKLEKGSRKLRKSIKNEVLIKARETKSYLKEENLLLYYYFYTKKYLFKF